MFEKTYIEALLGDEAVADEVWEAWDKGKIDNQVAWLAWSLIAYHLHCHSIPALEMIEF